jgi:hypothetical protein
MPVAPFGRADGCSRHILFQQRTSEYATEVPTIESTKPMNARLLALMVAIENLLCPSAEYE